MIALTEIANDYIADLGLAAAVVIALNTTNSP